MSGSAVVRSMRLCSNSIAIRAIHAEEHDDSTLAWWLATDNDASIKQYLDAGLPSSVSYRLEATHGGQTEVIVDREVPSGSVIQAFRIVWADDEIWDLNLQLWYGYREG